MRKTIYKWFWAWDFEKEEQWLNDMSAKGLCLVSVGYCKYTFEESIPNEYIIRLEFLKSEPKHSESKEYIHFIEDTGAQYLGSVMRWAYFKRKNELGSFDIYSDIDSRIQHLNRLFVFVGMIGAFNLVNALNMLGLILRADYQSAIILAILVFILSILCGFGATKILRKKKKLENDKNIFE